MDTVLYSVSRKTFGMVSIAEGNRAEMREAMQQKAGTDAEHWFSLYDKSSGKLITTTGSGGGCGAEARYRKSLSDKFPNSPACREFPWPTKSGRWGKKAA